MTLSEVQPGVRVHIPETTTNLRDVPGTLTGATRSDYRPNHSGGHTVVRVEVQFDATDTLPVPTRRYVTLQHLATL